MNSLESFLFYLFAATSVMGAALVVLSKRPTYSVLALTLTMLALSGLFVMLGAYFVAVIQVLIYAGAILVLFLFVIMLLGVDGFEKSANKKLVNRSAIKRGVQAMLVLVFLLQLLLPILNLVSGVPSQPAQAGTAEHIGALLFGRYLLPFELVSGILLVGIFGVVGLSGEEKSVHGS